MAPDLHFDGAECIEILDAGSGNLFFKPKILTRKEKGSYQFLDGTTQDGCRYVSTCLQRTVVTCSWEPNDL
jgi:hypothetical protein